MLGSKRPLTVLVQAQVSWRVAHDRQAGVFVGVCDALNLNAIGDSWADFQECANDAMSALFLDLFEDGELDRFLADHGWTMSQAPERGRHKPRFEVPASIELQPMPEFARTVRA